MAYKRRSSLAVDQTNQRLIGIKQITPAPTLPAGLSIAATEQKKQAIEALLTQYNGLLAQADILLNQIVDGEKELRRDNTKLLTAIGLLYGKDSPEYEAAGGTRTSEAGK
ncbi:MAG: hypothetical protein NTX57_09160 [Armatimonadetes bacterium]|nr:hypothetical protein [Armatimonadota bacterium]